ncbi:Protein of unknown function [Pseudomonas citronellolis]|uniref:Adhesin n=1 Tax=Pseudomonas citronellolis TaxID=53408 RepID=A0AAQ1HLG5_9PSED|nr:DUF1302 domain-containing protein [Pseudomonas citronellolis]MBH3432063.1 DUF1302 domain-containing protein [Pseudomonas citronellolis]MCP1603342.1 hypothetical protein [Pseudomonas citronellolis]MCP1654663.1 hypothetical protein [Pseudomonas citronellolis]MCP1721319.1 hypothetical protein [Pseudomonas citronellolis]TGC25636.1 DUF1302 domain-containing protein [Pseudomonas citronellolis]
MRTITRPGFFQPQLLALAVALGVAAPAKAVNFNIGEIEGQFDSSLSIGASWSTQSPHQDFIGYNNGGNTATHTTDDGRLNFEKGETFSKLFKGIHDLELKYGDTGLFVRGKYWYDFELKDESRPFKDIDDDGRDKGARSSGAQLLDAFVYHNYDIQNLPGSVRLGKQVVSWGESTFIPNSINSINPIDVSAIRRPGAEIKEALLPVNMFYLSQSVTDSLSVEGFYQLKWEKTVLDNCGTFFGTDVVPHGCNLNNANNAAPGFGALMAQFEPIAAAAGQGFIANDEGVILPRSGDREPGDSGQWGLALRWMTDDVEYGAYAMNYHSRNPYYSSQTANGATLASLGRILAATGAACGGRPGCSSLVQGMALSTVLGNSNYFIEYPEDIRLYGLSFATSLPTGTAWNGEISYRPNMPLQISTPDVTLAVLNPIAATSSPNMPNVPGGDNHGYERKPMTQVQTTFTHFFEQVMGADRLTLVGELGLTHLSDLEPTSAMRYGRSPEYGQWAPGNTHGFYTNTSWGYRARGILDYGNAIAGINLKPNIAWSHDVEGYGPTFNEGAKAISLGLDADYRNTYTASLSYTNFFGGDYNTLIDRDFLAFSVGVNF